MRESRRIAEQLRRAVFGPAWHGPSLQEILSGVSSTLASSRSQAGAHTIWEILLHIARWEEVVYRRLRGERIATLPAEEDWPAPASCSPAAWRRAIQDFKGGNEKLRRAIARFPDRRLAESVPGQRYSFYVMLQGVVQHDLYHAGQMMLLKKAR